MKNGFTTREEADRGLTLLQSVTSVSQVNLNACSQNPEACKNYIPDDYTKEYEAKKKIYEAISQEAGTKCLRAGSEAITACDDIARKFFGEEGVKELVRARAETKQAEEFYKKGVENLSLQRPTGETIVGKDAIRKACDTAFQNKDVASAKSPQALSGVTSLI